MLSPPPVRVGTQWSRSRVMGEMMAPGKDGSGAENADLPFAQPSSSTEKPGRRGRCRAIHRPEHRRLGIAHATRSVAGAPQPSRMPPPGRRIVTAPCGNIPPPRMTTSDCESSGPLDITGHSVLFYHYDSGRSDGRGLSAWSLREGFSAGEDRLQRNPEMCLLLVDHGHCFEGFVPTRHTALAGGDLEVSGAGKASICVIPQRTRRRLPC